MRQEKTMKVIANHFLDPRIKMTPNAGASDKSWVWVAFDFAEGELVETVRQLFPPSNYIFSIIQIAFI
jgi:Ran-binding protein 1